jgi:two-component sensor histidine kinase
MIQLVVSDNGIGIKHASEQKGESMGLSLVRSLVAHDLKGRMVMSAEAGTRFTIEFRRIE